MVVNRLDEIEGNDCTFEITGMPFSPSHVATSDPFWKQVEFKQINAIIFSRIAPNQV